MKEQKPGTTGDVKAEAKAESIPVFEPVQPEGESSEPARKKRNRRRRRRKNRTRKEALLAGPSDSTPTAGKG